MCLASHVIDYEKTELRIFMFRKASELYGFVFGRKCCSRKNKADARNALRFTMDKTV